MAEAPPSLLSVCIDGLTQQLLGPCDDDLLHCIYDLPSHLLDTLITRLPPFALHTFHHHLPFEGEGFSHDDSTKKRKRARDWNVNSAWQRLFQLRWPDRVKQIQKTDWEQLYWETHLQDCLDEAVEVALIPSFTGYIGNVQQVDLTGHIWDYKPEHVSPYTEFVHNGLPILVLPSPSVSAAPHNHDP